MRDTTGFDPFLKATTVVDWDRPEVRALARELSTGRACDADVARACFEWVRDDVLHTVDHQLDLITCTASETLHARSGFCYAKSHLLVALLRANGIPGGFVYQRLALDAKGSAFCLHGLSAVWLADHGWYRVDPRGNRADIRAEFDPPREVFPFACLLPGERLFPVVYAEPLEPVVGALRQYRSRTELEAHLPDAVDLDRFSMTPGGVVHLFNP